MDAKPQRLEGNASDKILEFLIEYKYIPPVYITLVQIVLIILAVLAFVKRCRLTSRFEGYDLFNLILIILLCSCTMVNMIMLLPVELDGST